MKIPTILSEELVPKGTGQPKALPESFGGFTARAMGQLGRAVSNVGDYAANLYALNARRKQIQEDDWVNESLIQEREHLVTWLHENRQDQDLASKFQQYVALREKEYLNKAPSPQAARKFQLSFRNGNLALYSGALTTQANTRVSNLITNIEEESRKIADTWRTARTIPGLDAGQLVQEDISRIYEFLDGISDITPATSVKLKSHVAEEVIAAVKSQDPELARAVLERSPIEEQRRRILESQIDDALSMKMDGLRLKFDRLVKDNLAALEAGNPNWTKIPKTSFTLIYPDKKGEALWNEYDAETNVFLRANEIKAEIAPFNLLAQNRIFSEKMREVSTETELKALTLVGRVISSNEKQVRESIATYITINNPVVRAAYERGLVTNDFTEYQSLLMRYQGSPPPGTPEKEQDYYFHLPSVEFQIVGTSQAENWATRINTSSPGDVLKVFEELRGQFKNPEELSLLWQQMSSLPSGKRVALKWQLAFLNMDEPFVRDFIVAQQSARSLEKLNDTELADIESAFNNNGLWNAFTSGLLGDNLQRVNDMAEFKEALINYSRFLMVSPTSGISKYREATRQSINKVLGTRLTVVNINGWNTWMSKIRQDGTVRLPDEVALLGKKLDELIDIMPLDNIRLVGLDNRPHWPGLEMKISSEEKERALRNELKKNGRWVTDPDLHGATLYSLGEDGQPFVISDTDGKAIAVRFDEFEAQLNFQRLPETWAVQPLPGPFLAHGHPPPFWVKNRLFTTNIPTAGRKEIKK